MYEIEVEEIGTPPTVKQKIEAINVEWIENMIHDYSIKTPKELARLSGVSYESLSAALNDKRGISLPIKSTLYWFFEARSYENFLK
jgi:hypothetical protein